MNGTEHKYDDNKVSQIKQILRLYGKGPKKKLLLFNYLAACIVVISYYVEYSF